MATWWPRPRPGGRDGAVGEPSNPDDGGFVLLESLITIALITVIMTALTTFFITVVSSTAKQRSQQSAIQIADDAIDYARGVGAAGAVYGRTQGPVNGQPTSCPSAPPGAPASVVAADARVSPWLAQMTALGSENVPPLPLPTLSTTPPPTCHAEIKFQVYNFVGLCWRAGSDSAASAPCTSAKTDGAIQFVRNVVAVTWPDNQCTNRTCVYVTATLLSGTPDPTFNFNMTPPPDPALTCVNQSSAVGETLRTKDVPGRNILANQDSGATGCSPSGGVPAFTFAANGLPAGLTMAADGTVQGAATGPAGDSKVTITMTDSFLRSTAASFTWSLLPPLVVSGPGNLSGFVGGAVTANSTATGGAGGPYTWTATGLPAGLTISSSGAISGTLTAPGTSSVVLVVTDKSGTRASQGSFTWTVTYSPLTVTSAGPQSSVLGAAIVPVTLLSSGGSGTVTWSDSSAGTLPAGLRISGNTVVGTPTAVVTNKSVSLVATDATAGSSQTTTFTWTVTDRPTTSYLNRIDTLGTPLKERSTAPSLTLSAAGGTPAYTWSSTPLPAGVKLSNGVLSGTPTAAGTWSVTLTVKDANNVAATTTFTWTIVTAPTITSPGVKRVPPGSTVSFPLALTCANTPCTYAQTAGTLPSGITLDPGTGIVSGAVGPKAVYGGLAFTVTDAAGASATTTVSSLVVSDPLTFQAPPGLTTPTMYGFQLFLCQNFNYNCAYSDQYTLAVAVTGGVGPLTFSRVDPPGGKDDFNDGNPTIRVYSTGGQGSLVTVRLRVTDATGATADAIFTWTTR